MNVASAFSCTVCQKTFTGPQPYQQHLASDRHKKKCVAGTPRNVLEPQPVVTASKSVLQCLPCNIPRFESISEACAHYESQEHRRRKLAQCRTLAIYDPPKPVESVPEAPLEVKPILPSSILLCEVHENFGEFCRRHGL